MFFFFLGRMYCGLCCKLICNYICGSVKSWIRAVWTLYYSSAIRCQYSVDLPTCLAWSYKIFGYPTDYCFITNFSDRRVGLTSGYLMVWASLNTILVLEWLYKLSCLTGTHPVYIFMQLSIYKILVLYLCCSFSFTQSIAHNCHTLVCSTLGHGISCWINKWVFILFHFYGVLCGIDMMTPFTPCDNS